MNIHLTKYGKGFPLIFFHGWGFDSQIWHHVVPALSTRYQVILVDLPGFGHSAMMGWAEFKQQLVTALPQHYAVIGWSLGGLYATRLAMELPQQITHLINVTSSPRFISDSSWPGVRDQVFARFHQNLAADWSSTLSEFIALQLNSKAIELPQGMPPSIKGLENGLNILSEWDLRQALAEIKIQVHYMFGRLDPITPIKTMQAMQALYPNFSFSMYHKSAHMPFLTEPELFVSEIKGLIK